MILPSLFRRFNSKLQSDAKILVADLSNMKELIYTGPLNSMVRRLQISLTATTVGTVVSSPLLLHYFTSGWHFASQTFFCLMIGGASALHTLIGQRILGRYVFNVYRLIPEHKSLTTADNEEMRLEISTIDPFGRPKRKVVSPDQIGADETGRWLVSGETRAYLIQTKIKGNSDYFRQLSDKVEGQ